MRIACSSTGVHPRSASEEEKEVVYRWRRSCSCCRWVGVRCEGKEKGVGEAGEGEEEGVEDEEVVILATISKVPT